MRTPKQPSRDQIALSDVLYALSDPVRLQILQGIVQAGEQPCHLCPVEMPKSSLSHHYKVLREAGVVSLRIDGTRHYYSARTEDLNALFPGLLKAVLAAADQQA